ncbi:MAG: hypothetical protein M3Y27_31190 [Acidobacteriota bacterium]|nr:hypothetical protein [Acidobacteriota bacterium]
MKTLTVSTLALIALSMSLSAATLNVYVGYADNLRPSGFFPTPWLGDANVVSQTPSGQSLDAGAVRIDNTGATPVTITGFTVALGGGQTFSPWSPLTIGAGQIGIFTQTSSYNFDSSDFGLFGAGPLNVDATHPLGGCTNPANPAQVTNCQAFRPVISFDAGSGPVSLLDTGHVLDTFGYDLINLAPPGGDGNESINWNLVGTLATRGGANTPEPASALFVAAGLIAVAVTRRRQTNKRVP